MLLCGCKDFRTITKPVPVYVDRELAAEFFEASQDAADMWNDVVPGVITGVRRGDGSECGIYVRAALPGEMPEKRYGESFFESDSCVFVVLVATNKEAEFVVIMAHEFGHMLKGSDEHNEDKSSLMRQFYKLGQVTWITLADAEEVAERLGLTAKR